MTHPARGKSPGPFSSIRSVVRIKNSKSSNPPLSPNKSFSSSTQSTSSQSSFGSGNLISPLAKTKKVVRRGSLGTINSNVTAKKAVRRGSLGTINSNVTAVLASDRRSFLAEADDDASVRSGRTARSFGSFGTRRMLGLPSFRSKEDATTPMSPSTQMSKKGVDIKKDPAEMSSRRLSKSPVQRGRSTTPIDKVAPMKSPLASPKKTIVSKAFKQQIRRPKKVKDEAPMDPAGTLQRLNSGCFHEPNSSSEEEEYDDNKSKTNQLSPTPSVSPRSTGSSPRGLEKTWSCSAMSVHSAGENSAQTNLYFDEDDSTDFDTDDEADRTTRRNSDGKKKKKKGRRGKRAPRRMTKNQRKKEKEAEERTSTRAEIIPEAINEDAEDSEDDSVKQSDHLNLSPSVHAFEVPDGKGFNDSATSEILNNSMSSNEDLDDIVSSCSYKMPAFGTMLGLQPAPNVVFSSTRNAGYSSDSTLIRKRMAMDKRQQLGDQKLEKKSKDKKKKKSKTSKKDKPKKKRDDAREQVQSFHESFVNYGYDEPDEVSARSSRSAFLLNYSNDKIQRMEQVRSRSSSQHHSKKDKKKKKSKSKRSSSTAGSTSDDDIYAEGMNTSFENNDSFSTTKTPEVNRRMEELDACFKHVDQQAQACLVSPSTYDSRYQEIEKFENFLFQERNKLQQERATIAFERESLELILNEETIKSESLALQVKELEQELQSMRLSHAGNDAVKTTELDEMKLKFERTTEDLSRQLREKDIEIQELKSKAFSSRSGHSDASSQDSALEGKSRDRLQGELLQATSKLIEKQQLVEQQAAELQSLRVELVGLQSGNEVLELKQQIDGLNTKTTELEKELAEERKDSAAKLKDKDETITYLMGELAKLKQEQSRDLNSSNHSHSSVSSLSSLRRGSLGGSVTSFLPPGLFNAATK